MNSNFAIIESGGKQYRVEKGDKLRIEKLPHNEGGKTIFDKVLLLRDGKETNVGTPLIEGARVEAKILEEGRDRKKIVFRYHSKTRYRKFKTHRQSFTEVEITAIK